PLLLLALRGHCVGRPVPGHLRTEMSAAVRSLRSRRWLAGPLALIALAIMLGSIFFITTGAARGQNSLVSTNPADILAGQQLFESHCQSCHGYQGGGATG